MYEYQEPAPRQREESKWTLPEHHPYFINEWREWFPPLEQRILDLSDPVIRRVTQYYVAYKNKNNGIGFVRLYGRGGEQGWFELNLPVNPWEINDPWNVCSKISEEEAAKYHRDRWKTRVVIATIGQRNRLGCNRVEARNLPLSSSLDYLMQLIRQVFETL